MLVLLEKSCAYFKCTTLVFMFPPMQFLMLTTTIKGFVTPRAPLIGLNATKSTNKLIRFDVTHVFL